MSIKELKLSEDFIYSVQFWDLLLGERKIILSESSKKLINASRAYVDYLGDNQIPTYGINTGFGEMITTLIPKQFAEKLQKNLIRTHATGAGERLSALTIRAIMLCRLITFSKGYSGISLENVQVILDMLNSDIYPVVHAQGSLGACLTKDSMVFTNPGKPKPISELNIGEKIYSFDGNISKMRVIDKRGNFNNFKYQFKANMKTNHVLSIINSGIKQTYKLKTYTREITCSNNHPFLKLNIYRQKKGQKAIYSLIWTELMNLNKGDLLLCVRKLPDTNNITHPSLLKEPSIEFIRLLGVILGDGHIPKQKSKNKKRIHYTVNIALPIKPKSDIREKYIMIIRNELKIEPGVSSTDCILIHDKNFFKLLNSLGFAKKALEKDVPYWIFSLPLEKRIAFLEGYIDADGCRQKRQITRKKENRKVLVDSIGFCSPNKNLIQNLRLLAITCGYRTGKLRSRNRIRGLWFNGRKWYNYDTPTTVYEFTIMNRGFFPYSFSGKINIDLNNPYFYFDKIKSIEKDIKQEVYDIQVENSHNFIAEGMIVHNSGDLSPLSEIARGLLGESRYMHVNTYKLVSCFVAKQHPPLSITNNFRCNFIKNLGYKEGLALINGTAGMTGISLINHRLAEGLIRFALVATAFCLNALEASSMPFDSEGTNLKGHLHNDNISWLIRRLIKDSKLIRHQSAIIDRLGSQFSSDSVTKADEFLQNAYSLRCVPQVLGSVLSILEFYGDTIYAELNGVDDNPIIIPDKETHSYPRKSDEYYVFHGAHFHGQAISFANDYLKIAITQLANLSNRRVARLIDSKYSGGLPDLLTTNDQGLNCAFEGLEYASASIVSEMRANTTPNSIQNVPSNLGNQDLVSMGMISARKCQENIMNAFSVIAVELIIACQAVDLRIRLKASYGNKPSYLISGYLGEPLIEIYYWIRDELGIKFMEEDRYLGDDLQKLVKQMISISLSDPEKFKIFAHPL